MTGKPRRIETSAATVTQTARAAMEIRQMIAEGRFAAAERLTETQLAERLNMSRTPLRAAVQTLRDEGLLDQHRGGGFSLRGFTTDEIQAAIEFRGLVEGAAARSLAEKGLEASVLAELSGLVDEMDDLFEGRSFREEKLATYARLNDAFHVALAWAPGSRLLAEEAQRANARPFAWASAFVRLHADLAAARRHLTIAQSHHRAVVDAIAGREGARAEAIMREHARLALGNLGLLSAARPDAAFQPSVIAPDADRRTVPKANGHGRRSA